MEILTAEIDFLSLKSDSDKANFVLDVISKLENGDKVTARTINKIATQHNLKDSNTIAQLCEKAIVETCRKIARHKDLGTSIFEKIKKIYELQPTIAPKDGQARFLNQFSTPCPIAWLIGRYAYKGENATMLEPTAGNGLLTIAFPDKQVTVNELDELRYGNLCLESGNASKPFASYHNVTNKDANYLDIKDKSFDSIVINPPFAPLDKLNYLYKEVPKGNRTMKLDFRKLDHKLAILALDKMKDNGRAAIIVGGSLGSKFYSHENEYWDSKGQLRTGEWFRFVSYLNRVYNLQDIIYLSGDFFRKQGTQFPTIILLVNGRRQTPNSDPLHLWHNYDVDLDSEVKSFDELFVRIYPTIIKNENAEKSLSGWKQYKRHKYN